MVLISVIIPCYNVERYIEECIEHVYSQSYKNIEVICVDNNSTDKTLEKLNSLKEKYNSIIIESELKPGAPYARNKGLSIAKGEWIQFLDADDLLLPAKIFNQIQIVKQSSDRIAFIAAAFKRQKVSGDYLDVLLGENNEVDVFFNKAGITSANLWRKSYLLNIGGWNVDLKSSQETDLMLRLLKIGCKYEIDTNFNTIIREREAGQISQRNPNERWLQYIDIRIDYIEYLRNKNPKVLHRHEGMMYDFLMVSIISLAKYNFDVANDYYLNKVKGNWNSQFKYGFSKLKVFLIKLFGLKMIIKFVK